MNNISLYCGWMRDVFIGAGGVTTSIRFTRVCFVQLGEIDLQFIECSVSRMYFSNSSYEKFFLNLVISARGFQIL